MTELLTEYSKLLVPLLIVLVWSLSLVQKKRLLKANQLVSTQTSTPAEPETKLGVTLSVSAEFPEEPLLGSSPLTENRIERLSEYSKETEEGRVNLAKFLNFLFLEAAKQYDLSLAKDSTPSISINTLGAKLQIRVLVDEEQLDEFKNTLQDSINGFGFKNAICKFENSSHFKSSKVTKFRELEGAHYGINDSGRKYAEFKSYLQAKFGIELGAGNCTYTAHPVPVDADAAELAAGFVQRFCEEFSCDEICVLPCDRQETMVFFNTEPPKAVTTKIGGPEVDRLLDFLRELSPKGMTTCDGLYHFRIATKQI